MSFVIDSIIHYAKDAALEALKLDATYQPTLAFLQAIDPGASTPEQTDSVSTPAVEEIETPKPTELPTSTTTPVEKENTLPETENSNNTDMVGGTPIPDSFKLIN